MVGYELDGDGPIQPCDKLSTLVLISSEGELVVLST